MIDASKQCKVLIIDQQNYLKTPRQIQSFMDLIIVLSTDGQAFEVAKNRYTGTHPSGPLHELDQFMRTLP